MNLLRKLKINKITSVEFTEKEKEIIGFIKSILDDLIPFKYNNYANSMFYMNSEGKWILEQDDKSNRLWIRYDDFWGVLDKTFSIEYDDIKNLLKYMVEQAFKQKVSTPQWMNAELNKKAEEAFKSNK